MHIRWASLSILTRLGAPRENSLLVKHTWSNFFLRHVDGIGARSYLIEIPSVYAEEIKIFI